MYLFDFIYIVVLFSLNFKRIIVDILILRDVLVNFYYKRRLVKGWLILKDWFLVLVRNICNWLMRMLCVRCV